MNKYTRLLSAFALLLTSLCSAPLLAQRLDSTLNVLADRYQPEKAYLHYDKASYSPGETIWFKAYMMEELVPATGSKTLYVDFVSETGEVLSHTVSPIVDGITNGSFEVPEDFRGTFLQVKAYTRWMLNFDTAFLYSKDIRIYSKNPAPRPATKVTNPTTVYFFPEGGEMIAGIPNRVAFKATDTYGMPMKIRGVITDSKGTVIDSLKIEHDGMGSLSLTPAAGETYKARWKDARGGAEQTTLLPKALASGVAMQVVPTGSKRYVSVQVTADVPASYRQLYLVGTMNQRQAFQTTINTTPGTAARKVIPTENLPSGILTMTLFDAAWNAIAERITFVNNREYLFQPKMEVERWGLNKRARNDIQITIPEQLKGAHLSVSVTDAGIDRDSSYNIISHLLLTSDLRGYVHQPYYYLSAKGDSVARHLDLLMMTNGWRRFKWEDLTAGKLPKFTYPKDTNYLALSGKLFGLSNTQLNKNDNLFLMIKQKDSGVRGLILPIEKDGSFRDPSLVFFDTLQVYSQVKSNRASADTRFMVERLPAPNYQVASRSFLSRPATDTGGLARRIALAAEALRLQQSEKGKVMDMVTVRAKSKTPVQQLDEKYASKGLFSGDGLQFDLVNDPSALGQLNILNYLQGKVAGLQISNTGAGSTPSLNWRGETPQLFLDEMPVDANWIQSIPVTDVAYVKVMRPPFFGGMGGGTGGAIAVYTRRGDDLRSRPASGIKNNTIVGYSPIREFHSPNYNTFDKKHEQKDIRTTLYWNPMLTPNTQNRTVKFSFFNNDVSKAFRVVIEGMSADGLLTHYEEIME